MNTSGCPEGFFTDEILALPGSLPACKARIDAWLGLAIPLLLLRWLVLIPQVIDQKRRYAKKRQTSSSPSSPKNSTIAGFSAICSVRIPIFLLSQIFNAFFSTLLVILASVNVVSSRNGGTFALFGAFLFCVGIGHMIMARTVIKLGRKIIPLSSKRLRSGSDNDRLNKLDRLDVVLRILGFLGILATVFGVILFLISPALNKEVERRHIVRVGFFSIALYQLVIGGAIVYQFQRCLSAISKLAYAASSSDDNNDSADANVVKSSGNQSKSKPTNQKIHRAIFAMSLQMYLTAFTVLFMTVLSVLFATFVIVLEYWIYCIVFLFVDVVFQAGLLFAPTISKALSSRSTGTSEMKGSSTNERVRPENQVITQTQATQVTNYQTTIVDDHALSNDHNNRVSSKVEA